MKILSLALAFLMIFSIFAAVFTIADSEDSNAEETNDTIAYLEVSDESSLTEMVEDSNKTLPGYRHFGAAQVTKGQGWAISEDSGYLVNVLWASQIFARAPKEEIQQIRQQYKNCTDSAGKRNRNCTIDAIDSLRTANDSIQKRAFGRLQIGVGKDHENFKLVKNTFDNKSVIFDVYTINSRNATRDKVGSLELEGKHYTQFTLWEGTLKINSGDHVGTYQVSLASKSVIANSLGKVKEIVKEQRKGFFQRLRFWRN